MSLKIKTGDLLRVHSDASRNLFMGKKILIFLDVKYNIITYFDGSKIINCGNIERINNPNQKPWLETI